MVSDKIILGGGCFWGIEEFFRNIKGVKKTCVGYSGGITHNPTYQDVCSGKTNHAEVVKIEFDNKLINYDEILDYFFSIHNPTTLNKQGPDLGTQYRSEIFFTNSEQKKTAKKILNKYNEKYNGKIVTKISEVKNYARAEDYHQKYLEKNI